jgi:hypothetical protein
MGLLEQYKDEINSVCKKYQVKSLYAFGSVITSRFTAKSDVDFLVDFKIEDPIEYTENYFDLKFQLEKILKRPIDLLEYKTLKNQYLKENIDNTKVLIYG